MNRVWFRIVLVVMMLFAALTGASQADVDTLVTVVGKDNAAGTASLSAFGYDPLTDTMYTSTFGTSGALRRITNVGGLQVSEIVASAGQIQLYYRDGDTTRSVGNPTQSSILLNPLQVGSQAPYSFAVITELATTQFPAPLSGTDSAATKRVYNYNLQPLSQTNPTSPTPPYNDGRDVFTTRVTLADMQAATTPTTTNTSSLVGRQPAFSSDGQSIYLIDSSTAFGGIWKVGALAGAPTQLLDTSDDINTEPAVTTAGGVDTIFFRGGGTTGNVGGIDKITHNLTTGVTSGRAIAVTAAAINDFLEMPSGQSITSFSMTADSVGNIYFNNTDSTPERRGIFKYDTQGRLSKVISHAERADEFGGSPNANTLRMQPRTVTFTGTNGSFPLTQLLYTESSSINLVAGANVFEAGDFNRDNTLSALDISLFKSENVLTTRGTLMSTVSGFTPADYKFDMNGNLVTDWKDVKIMQSFLDFGNGDADLNGIVDFADFQLLQNNFGQTGKTWFAGDFDGNDFVDFADFQILQNSFGYESSVLTGFTMTAFNQAEFDAFISTIPEPSTYALSGIGLIAWGIYRRRRAKFAA